MIEYKSVCEKGKIVLPRYANSFNTFPAILIFIDMMCENNYHENNTTIMSLDNHRFD